MIKLILLSLITFITANCSNQHAEQYQTVLQTTASAAHTSYQAKVVSIADGDTIRVTDGNGQTHKIRLAYIDTPELNQAHGKAARQALSDLLSGKNVDITVFEHDRYRREVAQVRLNGHDANLAQLENGHAWHYVSIARKKQSQTDYTVYARAESEARKRRIGLWNNNNPQAPWDFRKEAREKNAP
ncbi:MAG: thermonuclease family protein [Neisseria sp.]|uniref:thermonuclease family protein n=1 Tax=Neisseria sp. TaxID=192066 RepID=UPI0026DAA9B5|nr:thermonuclease family protein [Neisseria sp.]MDO4640915.1 thermonuclease family protein [Neisseria sp.]